MLVSSFVFSMCFVRKLLQRRLKYINFGDFENYKEQHDTDFSTASI